MTTTTTIIIDHEGKHIMEKKMTQADGQQGGSHYGHFEIDPITYAERNQLTAMEANAVKYVSRHRFKGGAEDLKKAMHYVQMLLQEYYGVTTLVEFKESDPLLSRHEEKTAQPVVVEEEIFKTKPIGNVSVGICGGVMNPLQGGTQEIGLLLCQCNRCGKTETMADAAKNDFRCVAPIIS